MRKVYVMGKILTIRLYMLMCMALLCIGCEAENEDFPVLFKSSSKLHEPYGLCTHINRKGEGWEFDCKDKDMEMAREIGTNFVRTDFDWGYCQPQKDKPFTFIHHQEMMNVVESRQLKMLGIFSPVWDNRYIQWLDYVGMTVRTFKRQVKYWEVINEADRWHLRYSDFKPTDYVRIIRGAYPLIKKEDKNAKVLFTSITDGKGNFFKEVLDSGVADYYDIMNFHFYVNLKTEPEYLFKYFKDVKSILDKYRISKPVWFTETGCTSAKGYADEDTQAKRLSRTYLISFACGIEKVFWYKTRAAERTDNFEDHFGIWHKDGTPKPAFYAYKALTRMCPSGSTRPRIIRSGEIYVAKWKNPAGQNVTAVWTSESECKIRISAFRGRVYDLYGNQMKINSDGILVTPSLLYFVGKKSLIMNKFDE